jgi:hypothetical protein
VFRTHGPGKQQQSKTQKKRTQTYTKNYITDSFDIFHGICSKDEVICKQLYGIEDFEFMIGFLEAAFEVEYQYPKENSPLNDMEQIFATLVFTNTTWNMRTIGEMFGIKEKTLSKYVNTWLPLLGECGDHMSDFLHFMDESAYDALEPQGYKDIGLRKVAALVDGKDFLTDTVRVDRVLNTI